MCERHQHQATASKRIITSSSFNAIITPFVLNTRNHLYSISLQTEYCLRFFFQLYYELASMGNATLLSSLYVFFFFIIFYFLVDYQFFSFGGTSLLLCTFDTVKMCIIRTDWVFFLRFLTITIILLVLLAGI